MLHWMVPIWRMIGCAWTWTRWLWYVLFCALWQNSLDTNLLLTGMFTVFSRIVAQDGSQLEVLSPNKEVSYVTTFCALFLLAGPHFVLYTCFISTWGESFELYEQRVL